MTDDCGINPNWIPKLGDIVHFVESENEHLAAVVSFVGDDWVHLHIFILSPRWISFQPCVPHDQIDKYRGTWHWPERE